MARSRKPQRRTPTKRAAPRTTAAATPPVGNDDPTEPMTVDAETPVPAELAAPTAETETPDPDEPPADEPTPDVEAPTADIEAPGESATAPEGPAPEASDEAPPVDETPEPEAPTADVEAPEPEAPAEPEVPMADVEAPDETTSSDVEPSAAEPVDETADPEAPVAEAVVPTADVETAVSSDEPAPAEAETSVPEDPAVEAAEEVPAASSDDPAPVAAEQPEAEEPKLARGARSRAAGRRGRRSARSAPVATNGATTPAAVEPPAEPEIKVEPVVAEAPAEVVVNGAEAPAEEPVVAAINGAATLDNPDDDVPAAEPKDADDADDATDDDDGDEDSEELVESPAAEGVPRGGGRGNSRQRGLRAALATLPVPEPGPSFWVDIDRTMDEQPALSITARPAIRPITEPPPLSQPSLSDHLGGSAVLVKPGDEDVEPLDDLPPIAKVGASRGSTGSTGSTGGGGGRDRGTGTRDGAPETDPFRRFTDASRANTRKTAIIAVLVVLAILIAGNALNRRGNDDATGAEPNVTTTASTTSTTAAPTTTAPAVPGLDPAAPLTSDGLGPLTIGATLRDLKALGVKANVDQPTFATSGGACYDVKITGAPDLTLRFRSPDPDTGLASADDGELASIAITIAPGSARVSETGVRLGAGEQDVRNAHDGNVEVSSHPIHPGGHMMVNYAGDGRGVAYGTDGRVVTEIAVGYSEVITQRQGCS